MNRGTARGGEGLQTKRGRLLDLLFWCSVTFVVIAFVVWHWQPAHGFAWKFDEGPDVMKARLLLEGHALYREIWSDHAPLFTVLLAAAFSVFGQSVFVGRVLVLLLSGLGLLAMGRIGRHLAGRPAALVMVVFMALMPQFHDLSRAILLGPPAIGVGLTALAAGFVYQSTGRLHWIAVSALLFGLSLLIKPVTAPLYLPLSAVVLLRANHGDVAFKKRLRWWVGFSAMVAGLLLLTLLVSGPRAFLSQVLGTFVKTREVHGFLLAENIRTTSNYLVGNHGGICYVGLLCLSGAGILSLSFKRHWEHLAILGLWLAGVFLGVLFHWPLGSQELILLMPPLTVAGAVGLKGAAAGVKRFRRASWPERVFTVAAVAAAVATVSSVPQMLSGDLALRADSVKAPVNRENLVRRDAMQFLQSHVSPDGVIITDDPMLAFKAGLSVPPAVANTSFGRVGAGELPASLLIDLSTELRPSAIIFWTGRLDLVTEYADWVRSNHYCAHRIYYGGRTIYVPCESVGARLGSEFKLTGWNIDTPLVAPGDTLTLTLYWQGLAQTDTDYHVFAHIGSDDPVAQTDGVPNRGEHPTYRWQVGEEVPDAHMLTIRADAELGALPIWVGMYDIGTRHRLPVIDAQGQPLGDTLQLTQIRVGEPDYRQPSPAHPGNVTIGQSIRLRGCDLASTEASPGETIDLTLYWECLAPMETSYTVFVHLLGPDGKLYGQQDSVPWGGRLPTTHWVAGEVITDEYAVPVSQDALAGEYTLLVGMYDVRTGIRLATIDADGTPLANNAAFIGEVTVNE